MAANARLLSQVAALLTTLADTNGSPESLLYLALGMDLDRWHTIRDTLTACGWIVVRSHYVTLTVAGRLKTDEITALLDDRKDA